MAWGKILVIDDEEITCRYLNDLLSCQGYEVIPTKIPKDGIKIFKEQSPSVTIVDLVMPSMDGIQVLSQLKSVNPRASVIIMTAYASLETAVKALNLSAHSYIFKPINDDEVIAAADVDQRGVCRSQSKVSSWREKQV